ncbi:MAG: hypothetical protein M3273_09285 [Actinomycetota bacterium]|nr:hypothetical protein [Actinomycetota bacterium]
MRLKLAIAACLAAAALPMAPASAAEGIPGYCYDVEISRYSGISTRGPYECECLLMAWPEPIVGGVIIHYCHAKTGLEGGS